MLERITPLLPVREIRKSIDFYTEKLGFELTWEDTGGFAILSRNGCDLFLGENQTKADLRNATARATTDGFASYDFFIHCAVGTIDGLWQEFMKTDTTVLEKEGPINREYGIRDFTVIDPDGYAIVFGSPIP